MDGGRFVDDRGQAVGDFFSPHLSGGAAATLVAAGSARQFSPLRRAAESEIGSAQLEGYRG